MVAVRVDVRDLVNLSKKLAVLPTELRDKATVQALNRVAVKGKTEIDRAIRAEYVIDAARVRNALDIRPASAKVGRVQAEILIFGSSRRKGRSLNVVHFMERKVTIGQIKKRRKAGDLFAVGRGGKLLPILRFQFKRGSAGKVIEGAFLGNKGRTVFVRTGDQRLPIKPVQVIDVPQMFSAKEITKRVLDRINRETEIELDRAIKLALSRL